MNRLLALTTLLSAGALAEVAVPPPMPAPLPEDAPLQDRGGRLRWGLTAHAGILVPGGSLAVAAEVRLGYQVSRSFSTFAFGGVSGVAFTHGFFGVIAEFMPVDAVYIGGGPLFAYGRLYAAQLRPYDSVGLMSIQEPALEETRIRPGLDFRFGFSSGASRPPWFRRGGFNIGVDLRLILHTDMQLTWAQGPGRPPVTTTDTVGTFTPMLVVGYDSR